MKIPLTVTLITASFSLAGTMIAETGAIMNEINQLVQTLVINHPTPRENAVMVENVRTSADFVRLKELCKTHWIIILDHLDTVVGEDAGKSMLLSTFDELEANSYMTVLERLADKFKKNQISASVMHTVLYPTGRMRMFLVDNYRHPRIQTLLTDLRPCFEGDTQTQGSIDRLLSGERKKMLDRYRADHRGLEHIPKVPLERSRVARPTAREAVRPSTITKNESDGVPENQRSGFDATAKREQPQNDPAPDKGTPWKLPLLIGVAAAVALAAWLRFRKK